ncbi:MAG: SRPBCC family protein [Candidatus Bathyarchaeia archaeon]
MGKIVIETEIEAPIEKVFAFLSTPKNWEKLMPEEANFKVEELTEKPSGFGCKCHITAVLGGKKIEQVMETVEFEKNRRDVAHQIKGDMKKFEKTHLFEVTDKGTKVTGTVEYELPYSILGKIMDKLKVEKELSAYFKGVYDKGKEILEEAT